jgi:serine protease
VKRCRFGRLGLAASIAALLAGCNLATEEEASGQEDVPGDLNSVQTTYTVAGTITAVDSTLMDTDVNDPSAPYVPNDPDIHAAQVIPNPVTLGGYVNLAGQGAAGRSKVAGDPRDFYRVQLVGDQVITLYVGGDPERNDLDLYVYNSSGDLVDASADIGSSEQLSIKDAGTYYVLVEAWPGVPTTATNYVLSVGLNVASTAVGGGMTLQSDFMPGEVLAEFNERNFVSQSAVDSLTTRAAQLGLLPLAGAPGRVMRLGVSVEDPSRLAAKTVLAAKSAYRSLSSEAEMRLRTLLEVKALMRRKDIAHAALNFRRETMQTPNDPLYRSQWHYPMINLPSAWDITTGTGAIVAVLDTGVVLRHPDLQAQLVSGYDFISYTSVSVDGDGIDANPDDPGDQSQGATSSSFHGTHVSGTVAAASNNGIGVAGVAWGAKVMPIRVLGKGGGYDYDILQGAYFAAGLANDSRTVPSKKADVLNMSLGGSGSSSLVQAAYDKVRAAGVIIIAAAGNSGKTEMSYPASYNGVVSVGALDIRKIRASYSQYNSAVDVAAPGGYITRYWGGGFMDVNGDGYDDGVMSTMATGGSGSVSTSYGTNMGTSMACPHMAGVAALMRAVFPGLTPQQFDDALASGAITEDLGAAGRDNEFGWGMIDAVKAIQAAQKLKGGATSLLDPKLSAAPSALNFGNSTTDLSFSVRNSGGGDLSVISVTEDSSGWLKVVPASSISSTGLGSYNVTIVREKLVAGTYAAKIKVTSSANVVEIPVVMGVAQRANAGDAGKHYVLLVDVDKGVVVADATLSASNGYYTYTLDGVAPGTYVVIAGTDLNNDGFICDGGEACGGFPKLYGAERLTVDSNKGGVDFGTGFAPQIWAGASALSSGEPGAAPVTAYPRYSVGRKHVTKP